MRLIPVVLLIVLSGGTLARAESWWIPVTRERVGAKKAGAVNISGVEVTGERRSLEYPPLRWQTSMDEFELGRHAPLNSCGVVGMPGWPVQAFGHQTYVRYPEFLMFVRLERDGKEIKPYTLEKFRQHALGGYLPAIVTEFDDQGLHYELSYLMAPTRPQPIDIFDIQISNVGTGEARGRLLFNFDGAPTLRVQGDLLEDRGKPLGVLQPRPEEVRVQERTAGLVDPRCTAAGSDAFMTTKHCWRDGYYGMPIEYMFKVEPGKRYQVFLGTDGTPAWICFGRGYDAWRKVVLSVEGEDPPQTVELNYARGKKPLAHRFIGRDADGDGWLKVSSRATPDARQPSILNAVWVFEEGTEGIDTAALAAGKPGGPTPKYAVQVGANGPSWRHDIMPGEDPTWKALSLRYTPLLKPGERRRYTLRLPAIDRLELMAYCNSYHPYDTDQSWMRNLEPRHPENQQAYGEDVPPDRTPEDYAAYGPKSRVLWAVQLKLAGATSFEKGTELLKAYWDNFLAQRVRFHVPDEVLERLYRTQLAFLDMFLLKFGPHDIYAQMGGPFNYWDFCYRDNSYEMRAWDMAGFSDIAQKLCDSLLVTTSKMPVSRWTLGQWDDAENAGLWLTRPGQWDGQGQTLGALADHYLLTGDKAWLKKAWPNLENGARWIMLARERQKKRVKDPNNWEYGLYPPGELEAAGAGNPYYINAYGVYGLRMVARAAEALGKKTEAAEFSREAADFHQAFMNSARQRFVRLNDYCGTLSVDPKDQTVLNTWPGSSLVYPLGVFEPFDPLIEGWNRFREIEASEQGGVMGFPYIYADWIIGYLRRGEPDRFVDLFGSYIDTGSEMNCWSEGQELYHRFTEDFEPARTGVLGAGDMPHAEACSNFIILLRNMLVHEDGDTLHLAPGTPRRWMAQDQPFGVEAAPSYFGRVSFQVTAQRDRQSIKAAVKLDKQRLPARLLLHLRTAQGRGLKSVELNGKRWEAIVGDTVVIPRPPSDIKLTATLR